MGRLSFRVSLRGMLDGIACVAVLLALKTRSDRFARISEQHQIKSLSVRFVGSPDEAMNSLVSLPSLEAIQRHHADLAMKYDRAASRPWSIVPADPPAPDLGPDFELEVRFRR